MPKKSKAKLKSQHVDGKVPHFQAEVFRNSAAVLDDTDPHESLKYMKEIFRGKLDEDVVVMIFSECAYDVNQAFETLMSLCNEEDESISTQIKYDSSSADTSVVESASSTSKSNVFGSSLLKNLNSQQLRSNSISKDFAMKNFSPSLMNSDIFQEKQTDDLSEMPLQDTSNGTSIGASIPGNSAIPENSLITGNGLSLFKSSDGYFNDNTYFSPKSFKSESNSSVNNMKGLVSNRYSPSSIPQFITPLLPTPIYKFGSPVYHRLVENKNSDFQSSSERIHTSAVSLDDSAKKKVESPLKDIVEKIKTGRRIMIILRGLPGSGKSTLGRKLRFSGVVYSTDDFFIKRGKYIFDCTKLSEAHEWNRRRTKKALEKDITPIIIDNTNIEAWEMSPYVVLARKYRYEIFILEPNTPWKFNVRELYLRNRHGVSKEKITKMKERYQHNITVENMIKSLSLLNLKDLSSLDGCDVSSKSGTTTKQHENEHGMSKYLPNSKNVSLEAVIHQKPPDLLFENQTVDSKVLDLTINEISDENVALSTEANFVHGCFVSENIDHSDVTSHSASNEKLEIKESVVIGNLEELKALMHEDSDDSQSHNDSTNGSNQDIACWEAITEHDDDFCWSASSEDNMNSPFINNHNINDIKHSKKTDNCKNINISEEISTKLNFNEKVDIQVSSSKRPSANEIASDKKLNLLENTSSESVGTDVPSQNPFSPPNQQSEKSRNNENTVLNPRLKSNLFSFSKDNVADLCQFELDIPEIAINNHDITDLDGFKSIISQTRTDVKSNLIFSSLDSSYSCIENEFEDKPTDTKESSFVHEKNNSCTQDSSWNLSANAREDNIGETDVRSTVSVDVVCPKPKRSYQFSNPDFLFAFNKNLSKDTKSACMLDLDSIHSQNSSNWELSEFNSLSEQSEFGSKNIQDNSMMIEATVPKHQRQTYENANVSHSENISNHSVKEENYIIHDCKHLEKEELSVQSNVDTKNLDRKVYAKRNPFLQFASNDIGSEWKFPDYVQCSSNYSDQHESIVSSISSCTQTEPHDFVLLYKIAKGNDFSSDYLILSASESTGDTEISENFHLQDPETVIFSKAPKFEKSTCTDDMSDDLKIEQKLYQLQECFPDIAEEDLRHLLEMCHNNDTWLSNLLLEWGYKYNVSNNESVHDCTLDDSSLEHPKKKNKHLNSSYVLESNENKDLDLFAASRTCEDLSFNQKLLNFNEIKNTSVIESGIVSDNQNDNCSKTNALSAPKSFKKLQLILDPAFAYQLEEAFGPVANRSPHGSLSALQRCVDIDFEYAKLIYDKWQETVQDKMKMNNITDADENVIDIPFVKTERKLNESDNSAFSSQNGNEPLPLSEIMDMEYALQLHRQEKLNKDTDFATKLKRLELYNMFPGADTVALDEIFESNNFSLKDSVLALGEDIGQPKIIQKEKDVEKIDKCVAEWSNSNCFEDFENDDWKDWVYKEENIGTIKEAVMPFCPPYICSEALKLREIATEYYHLRQESIRKAQGAYCRGMKDVASFYAQQGKEHGLKFKEANKQASELIAKQRKMCMPPLVLDLHGLYVQEAIPTLEKFLRDRKLELRRRQQTFPQTISVITGKGIHSMRGPKLRPSVMEFLKKTGYRYTETNPGMVEVTIFPE